MKVKDFISTKPFVLFGVIFLLMWFGNAHDGGTNPASRFALMRAMSLDRSFAITPYKDWTIDWSQGPDGQIYSNKAPGASFLGMPAFLLLDRPLTDETRMRPPNVHVMSWVSNLMQTLPYFIVGLLIFMRLTQLGLSSPSLQYASVAYFFGNTAALMTGVYFGHTMAAWLMVTSLYFFTWSGWKWRWGFGGLSLGFALLTDYGSLFLFPAIPYLLFKESHRWRHWIHFVMGSIAPGILWVFYHEACFGSAFKTGQNFMNPSFGSIDQTFNWIPSLDVIVELLFGSTRGILVTQPWIFLVMIGILINFRRTRPLDRGAFSLIIFSMMSFVGLLWMNAGFHGWHGGSTPGPRYMSLVFPVFAILSGFVYESSGRWLRLALNVAMVPSIVLCSLVFSKDVLSPEGVSVWSHYLEYLRTHFYRHSGVNFVAFWIVWMVTFLFLNRSRIQNLFLGNSKSADNVA